MRPSYNFNLLASAENFVSINNLHHWVLVKSGAGFCVFNPNHALNRGR